MPTLKVNEIIAYSGNTLSLGTSGNTITIPANTTFNALSGTVYIPNGIIKLDSITTSATATYNLTYGGSAYSPASATVCLVSVNGVLQTPGTAFTISGSQITFSSALNATDIINFIIVLAAPYTINAPGDGSVSNTSLASTVITGQTAVTVPATDDVLLCYDTSATALRKITFANFGNTPAFSAKRTGNQSITDSTWTKIQFQTENFDTNSCYDNSTNYRFTPTTAGKYYVFASIGSTATTTYGNAIRVAIYKNGTQYRQNSVATWQNTTETYSTPFVGSIIDFNGSTDYVEACGVYESSSGPSFVGDEHSEFGAYKLIGV